MYSNQPFSVLLSKDPFTSEEPSKELLSCHTSVLVVTSSTMMFRVVLGVIAVIGFFTLSEALTCNSCKVGILGKCLMSSQVSCAASELNCYTAKAEFNVTGFLSLSSSGCTSDCNNTAGTVLGAAYTVTKTCCATSLCNGASAVQLSVAGAFSAALLASVWSGYML